MKKYLFLSLAAIVGMLAFTACGDDEPEPNNITNPDDVVVTKATFTEKGDVLTLTYATGVAGVTVTTEWTCTFSGNQLKKSVTANTYPSDKYAKAAYESAKEEYGSDKVSISGKKVTIDTTEDFKDMTKDVIRQTMITMRDAYSK